MSERRDETRRRKRIAVRFWKRGDSTPRSGFTTNISSGGMFIGSNHVLGRGSRLRVEVMDPTNGFMVEGVVARAERSRPELRSVRTSGMGIRFLKVEELVGELFPKAERVNVSSPSSTETASTETASRETGSPGARSPVVSGGPAAASPRTPQPSTPSAAPSPSSPAAAGSGDGSDPGTAESEAAAPPQSTRKAAQLRGFAVRYASLDDLRRTYERDIRNGGLFISSPDPADRGDIVIIEIRPPESAGPPFRLRARVVHTFERGTHGGTQEANLLSGMGVEWLDPEAARKSFEYYLGDAAASA